MPMDDIIIIPGSSQQLLELLMRNFSLTVKDVAHSANLSEQTIRKILHNKITSKQTYLKLLTAYLRERVKEYDK